MKKLSIFATTLLFALTMMLSVNVTYAYEPEDDMLQENSNETGSLGATGNQSINFDLLSNSTYEFIITVNDSYKLNVDDTQGSYLEIEAMVGSFYYNNSMNPSEWESYSYSETFTTGSSGGEFEYYSSYCIDSGSQYWDDFVDVQLYFVSQNGAVDEVPPTYSFSNFEVNTPYYDLITEAEIRAQLSATDPEEGDVTSRIAVYNDNYTSETIIVGGNYYIIYVVDDTVGNSAYLQVDINVVDEVKPYFVVTAESLIPNQTIEGVTITDEIHDGDARSFTFYEGGSTYEILDLQMQMQAYDVYSGAMGQSNESWSETFSAEDPTGSKFFNPGSLLPGNYALDYTVTDPNGNSATVTFNYEVLVNNAPIINGLDTADYEISSGNLESILSLYSAIDTEDGAVAVEISNTSLGMGEESWSTPALNGTFTVTLIAEDSLGKSTTKDITVTVIDSTQPVFKIDSIEVSNYTINVNMTDTTTLQALIDSIIVSDVYDGDLSSAIVVPSFPNFAIPGETVLNLTCEDPQGNSSTLALTVNVIDDIAPVINGATKIVKGINATLTLSDITAELSSTDNVDGIIAVEVVTDGYTGNSGNLGSYVVQYKATDSSGNISYHDVRVWVVDNQAPVWILNDFFVNITANEAMARTELVSLLQASGMIGSDISYTVTFVTDEYSGNEAIEGAYEVVMNVIYEDGSEDTISVQLNVPEVEADNDVIVVTPDEPLTGLQKTIQWVKTAASNVGNFFKAIGNGIKTGAVWTFDHLLKPAWDFIFVKDTPEDIPVYTTDPVNNVVNTGTTDIVPTELPNVSTTESLFNQL